MKQDATLDSSFWINVHRSGLLDYVLAEYVLHYAPEVAAELSPSFPSGQAFWHAARAGELSEAVPRRREVREFGPGERAAIDLALEHRDWVLLLDDYRPFQEAVRRGLRVLCSPTLIVSLFSANRLQAGDALASLARLAAIQTVSPHLLAAALAQIGRLLRTPGR